MWTFRDLKVSLSCGKTFEPRRRILTIFGKVNITAVIFLLETWITLSAQGREWCGLFSGLHRKGDTGRLCISWSLRNCVTHWFLNHCTILVNDEFLYCSADSWHAIFHFPSLLLLSSFHCHYGRFYMLSFRTFFVIWNV